MSQRIQGGSYLLSVTDPQNVFTPEDFNDEHRLLAETVANFIEERVLPRIEELDGGKDGLMRELLMEAGELGLLGADVPEEYGGIETDEICTIIIAEKVGPSGSFSTGHGVHTCIGSLPIVFFGNEEQKRKYLPGVASGRLIGAYALTEPGAGSDALSIKTCAELSTDGKNYIFNGGKTFISNAGIAGFFIVYAKIEGEKFSAFIVDADSDGLSTGQEEQKMGLKGSSTRSVYFENVKVPVENLLYKPGKGHAVAFNTLNIGRHKVSAQAMGASKYTLDQCVAYANERKQFKVPIAQFGLIQEKLATMAIQIFAAESIVYRNGGLFEAMIKGVDRTAENSSQAIAKGIGEYAIECSLEKVFVTETEAFVVDAGVQIHGGYGFIADYPVERLYRDSRVKRIFEGTNEINRILIPTTLLRRMAKGSLPLESVMKTLKLSLGQGLSPRETTGNIVQAIKDVYIFLLSVSMEKYADDLGRQQQVLSRLADIAIQAYAADSVWVRLQKSVAAGAVNREHRMNLTTAFIHGAVETVALAAREIIATVAGGEEGLKLQSNLNVLLQIEPVDIIGLRQKIGSVISAAGKYVC